MRENPNHMYDFFLFCLSKLITWKDGKIEEEEEEEGDRASTQLA